MMFLLKILVRATQKYLYTQWFRERVEGMKLCERKALRSHRKWGKQGTRARTVPATTTNNNNNHNSNGNGNNKNIQRHSEEYHINNSRIDADGTVNGRNGFSGEVPTHA